MPQRQYEVETIIGDMFDRKTNETLWEVKWKGYPSSENTWQQRHTLCHLPLFKVYQENKRSAKKSKSKNKKTKKTIIKIKRNNDEYKKMKKSLLEHTVSAPCTMDLISILKYVNITDIKQFIHQQIDTVLCNTSIKTAYFNALPIDQILSSDIIQYILSFGHLNENRTINKEWSKYLIQNENISLNKRYQFDQKIDNDSIFEDIRTLERKMHQELDKLQRKYKEEQEQIKISYEQQIQKLKDLSTRVCEVCGNSGDIDFPKCIECGHNVCDNRCLVYCGCETCETEEQYCFKCCDWVWCAGVDCDSRFCSPCFAYCDQCEKCKKLFCGGCIEVYIRCVEWEFDPSIIPTQCTDVHVLLCKSCKEFSDIETAE